MEVILTTWKISSSTKNILGAFFVAVNVENTSRIAKCWLHTSKSSTIQQNSLSVLSASSRSSIQATWKDTCPHIHPKNLIHVLSAISRSNDMTYLNAIYQFMRKERVFPNCRKMFLSSLIEFYLKYNFT